VVKLKKNNYQYLPWNNTIEEDTICYPDFLAGGIAIFTDDETLFLLSDSSHHNLDVIIIQI
jgi:hypothetical protein